MVIEGFREANGGVCVPAALSGVSLCLSRRVKSNVFFTARARRTSAKYEDVVDLLPGTLPGTFISMVYTYKYNLKGRTMTTPYIG